MSKNRHDMLTAQVPNELQYRTCSQLQVYPLSVSDCLSVCLSVCVVNMYCIRMQCIPLSVSVHLSVCVICTVSLFVLYFRTPFLFTSVK